MDKHKPKKPDELEEERRRAQAEKTVDAGTDDDEAWAHLQPHAAESTPERAKKRDDYMPKRFRPDDRVLSDTGHPAPSLPVSEKVRWAATELSAQLQPLAQGLSVVPAHGARRPTARTPRSVKRLSPIVRRDGHDEFGLGSRPYSAADERAVLAAYRAWAGLGVERAWELVLAEEVRAALVLTQFARMHRGPYTLPDGRDVDFDGLQAPGPEQVLEAVRRRCPPDGVPAGLTVAVVEQLLEHSTDARRGGGRGGAQKRSVEGWIEKLRRTILKHESPQRPGREGSSRGRNAKKPAKRG